MAGRNYFGDSGRVQFCTTWARSGDELTVVPLLVLDHVMFFDVDDDVAGCDASPPDSEVKEFFGEGGQYSDDEQRKNSLHAGECSVSFFWREVAVLGAESLVERAGVLI